MRLEFTSPSFQEQYVKCPSCEQRRIMDGNRLAFYHRLEQYRKALRRATRLLRDVAQDEFELVLDRLDRFIDAFRDAHEAERKAYGEMISQYSIADQYGLGDTRMRRGVSANREQWDEARLILADYRSSFDALSTALFALQAAFNTSSDCPSKDPLLQYFMLYGFVPIELEYNKTQAEAIAFEADLAPWLADREAAAFDILAPLAKLRAEAVATKNNGDSAAKHKTAAPRRKTGARSNQKQSRKKANTPL